MKIALQNFDLTVSIVLYETDSTELGIAIKLIKQSSLKIKVFLVDNSPTDKLRSITQKYKVEYIFNNRNVGYGTGHNIAVKAAEGLADYHLVMNADVEFNPIILERALRCMEDNPDVGMLSPRIHLRSGELQHFCRLLPDPFDLFARRFIPGFFKSLFRTRLNKYVQADKDYHRSMNIPNLPGCFMFLRVKDFKEVNGFDENIFLYVEDIDLTRRMHAVSKTVYYPDIEITHGLARGSYKFSKLVIFHIRSAIYYFIKWGWIVDATRKSVNQKIILGGGYVSLQKVIRMPVTEVASTEFDLDYKIPDG